MPLDIKCVEVPESTSDVIKTEGSILVTEIVDELLVAASEEERGKYFNDILLYPYRCRYK